MHHLPKRLRCFMHFELCSHCCSTVSKKSRKTWRPCSDQGMSEVFSRIRDGTHEGQFLIILSITLPLRGCGARYHSTSSFSSIANPPLPDRVRISDFLIIHLVKMTQGGLKALRGRKKRRKIRNSGGQLWKERKWLSVLLAVRDLGCVNGSPGQVTTSSYGWLFICCLGFQS